MMMDAKENEKAKAAINMDTTLNQMLGIAFAFNIVPKLIPQWAKESKKLIILSMKKVCICIT